MEEVFLDIEGYEGLYQVSNLGNVKSLVNNKGVSREKILKLEICSDGYKRVMLCKNKTKKRFKIHRLVAQSFIENPNNYPCVNHKDENKQNNVVENLEWCTAKFNCNYGTRNERISESLSKQVYQYSKDCELIAVWESTNEASINGFNKGAVSNCCNNCYIRPGNNVYKGYIWSYTPLI